jgi:DNA-binding NarL/FixJ family response regulator
MEKTKIKVMIIDDHQLIIDGIKALLQDENDIEFIAGANNMLQALDIISETKIDVALVDISMPGESGIAVTKKLKELSPDINVLALTMHEDIQMITQMIEAGASGYIFKRTSMNEVLDAIKTAARNEKYLSQNVQAVLMENIRLKNDLSEITIENTAKLSEREKEILNLIAKEMNNEEIANKLFISERTVEAHRRNIFTKTNTKSIVGLIKYAIKNDLIDYNK